MTLQTYFPTSEAARAAWINNYLAKIPTLGVTCGITATEITSTVADINFYLWVLQIFYPAMQQEAQSATAYKQIISNGSGSTKVALPMLPSFSNPPPVCLPGVLPRLFNQIVRIKASPAYTESIGRDLGIIGMNDSADHSIPELSAVVEQGINNQCVRLNYTKYGHDGVHIESRRNDGPWEFLAINNVKPHVDNRPFRPRR